MSVSDLVGLVSAIVSLVATIAIAIIQYRQSKRMNLFEIRQAEIEEKRYQESVEIQARQFLVKYHDTIDLLPLCAIAFSYDSTRLYFRAMYSEFLLLSEDVRLKIFEYCGLKMCDVKVELFTDCMFCLRQLVASCFSYDYFDAVFGANGAYVRECIDECPNELLSNYYELIGKVNYYFHQLSVNRHIGCMRDKFIGDICHLFCDNTLLFNKCVITCYLAINFVTGNFLKKPFMTDVVYGFSDMKHIETGEDLFLFTLFKIWSNLPSSNEIMKYCYD